MKKLGLIILMIAAINIASAQNGYSNKDNKVRTNSNRELSMDEKNDSITELGNSNSDKLVERCFAINGKYPTVSSYTDSSIQNNDDKTKDSYPEIDSVRLS